MRHAHRGVVAAGADTAAVAVATAAAVVAAMAGAAAMVVSAEATSSFPKAVAAATAFFVCWRFLRLNSTFATAAATLAFEVSFAVKPNM